MGRDPGHLDLKAREEQEHLHHEADERKPQSSGPCGVPPPRGPRTVGELQLARAPGVPHPKPDPFASTTDTARRDTGGGEVRFGRLGSLEKRVLASPAPGALL